MCSSEDAVKRMLWFRPGQIQWEGVQDMVYILKQGQSSTQDIIKMLKQYLRTNSPTVILKALTVSFLKRSPGSNRVMFCVQIVDSLVINCGSALHEKLVSDKWPSRISCLAQHSDKKVQQAALQLISNYSHTHKSDPPFQCFTRSPVLEILNLGLYFTN